MHTHTKCVPGLSRNAFSLFEILSYFQSGSSSQLAGNPIAATSTLGWACSNDFNCCLKSLPGWVAFCKYAKQQSWAYSLVGSVMEALIQSPFSLPGNWGFRGYLLFQVREWCARQLRRATAHLHQLSRYSCCGKLNSLAIFFLSLVSFKLQKIRDNVPNDTTSKVFQTGGIIGLP